jgi:hypothetical protein
MNSFNFLKFQTFPRYCLACLAVVVCILSFSGSAWGQITYTTNPSINTWVSTTCSNTNAANTCPSTHLNGAVRARVSSISADGQNITFQIGTCSGGNFQSAGMMMGAWDTDYNCNFTTGGVTYGTSQNMVTFTTTNSFFAGGTGASYLFGVRANSTGQRYYAGNITVSRSFTSGITLSSPSNNATNVSLTPTLSWQAANGTSIRYFVNVKQNGVSVHNSGTTWLTNTSYTVPSGVLTAGTTYTWEVTARFLNTSTTSPVSSRTFTTALSVPATPTGLTTFYNASNNSINISWNSVAGATEYRIYKNGGSTPYAIPTTTSHPDFSPIQGTSNCYTVQACNSAGCSAQTASSCVSVPAPCNAPTGLSVGTTGLNTAPVSWNSVAGAVNYTVQSRQVGFTTWNPTTVSGTSTTISGLTSGVSYEWQVRANCSSNNSNFTSGSNFTTQTCPTPTGTFASNITSTSATTNWNSMPFSGQGYSVQYRVFGASFWSVGGDTFNTFLTLTGLNPSTTYEFRVRNECTVSLGSVHSNPIQFTTLATPCNAPTGLTVSNIGNTSATVSWSAVSGATGYALEYKTVAATSWVGLSTANTSFNLTSLASGTIYMWRVTANCSANNSTIANGNNFTTTTPPAPCNAPTGLIVSNIGNTSATVSWSAVSGATGYALEYKTVAATSWVGLSTANTSFNLTSLASGTTYMWRVTANCSANNSTVANGNNFTVGTTINSPYACHTPTLRFPFANADGIPIFPTIQWETVKIDNLTVTYELQNRNVSNGETETFTTTTNRYEHSGTGLVHNTNYEYRVRGVVNGQFTDWTNWQSYKTYAAPPTSGCGSPMGHWLNAIVFRDVNTCSWTSCNSNSAGCAYISGVNTGLKWECVEFVRRFLKQVYNINIFIATGLNSHANLFLANGPNAGLRAIPNGTGNIQVGDLIVWGGTYGHVGQVRNIYANKIEVIHQNFSNTNMVAEFSYTVNNLGFPNVAGIGGVGNCLGWLRTAVNYSGITEGQVMNTTTPTISIRKMGNGVTYKLFIAERNPQTGCYSLYHQMQVSSVASTASNVNFSLVSKPLQKGRQYRYRINTVMPNNIGEVQNPPIYFTTSANAGLPNKVGTVQDGTKDVRVFAHTNLGGNKIGLSNATVAVKLGIEWFVLGTTNETGIVIATDLSPNLQVGDSIYVEANGYKTRKFKADVLSIVASAFDVLLERDNTMPNVVTNPSILLWDDATNQAIIAPYSKQANVKLRITANGNSHFHLPTGNEPDDASQWQAYTATSPVIAYVLQEGENIVNVKFTNATDTIFYSTIIRYIPENKELDETYNVKIKGESSNIGAKVYLNGVYLETLAASDKNIRVPLGSHTFSFTKEGCGEIFEIVEISKEIDLNWQLTSVLHNEKMLGFGLDIYPNPTTSMLNLRFTNASFENVTVSLQDLAGKTMIHEKDFKLSEEKLFNFNLEKLPSGAYTLFVKTSKVTVVRKIVKQ